MTIKKNCLCLALAIVTVAASYSFAGEEKQEPFPDLRLSGSLRLRYERQSNYNIKRYGIGQSDDFLLTRLRLNFDLMLREDLHAFAQLQDAHFFFSNLSRHDFPKSCPYENRLDLRQAYIEHKKLWDSPFGLKLGRQAINYGDNRIWGPGDSTGSIGVVTLNLNRIGYTASTRDEFFNQLKHIMTLAKESLETKREIVNNMLDKGLMPYTSVYLGHFENHFSTIGLVGMHECCLNFLNSGLNTPEGKEFALDVLNFMRSTMKEFQEETGCLYNLEASPAESTSYRLARMDKQRYPSVITAGTDQFPYLTNSSQLNVDATRDIFEALQHQKDLQPLYTGGTIFHSFLPESVDGVSCKKLVQKIAETRLPYFSITPTFSVCRNHGYLEGEVAECPDCHGQTEVYSRIVGYLRPVATWNDGKKQEFAERTPYSTTTKGEDYEVPAVHVSELPKV